jgi:hypothetical protein
LNGLDRHHRHIAARALADAIERAIPERSSVAAENEPAITTSSKAGAGRAATSDSNADSAVKRRKVNESGNSIQQYQ